MAAVSKVLSMLEDLKTKVMSEGELEAKSYNTFACFCKDTIADKNDAISTGTDNKATLSSTISDLENDRETLDTTIQTLLEEIEAIEKELAEAKAKRARELKQYEINEADLSGAIYALDGAIKSMKASESPSFAQMKDIMETVRTATVTADALGLGGEQDKKLSTAFLQGTDVPTEDYTYHSTDIITTLESLLTEFKAEKTDVDTEEASAVSAHEAFVQEKTDLKTTKEGDLETAKKEKAAKQEEIATQSTQLSTVAAVLLDDQQYLAELAAICQGKASTYDKRIKVRQDELSALTAAITIIGSTVSEKTSAATIRFAQQGVSVRLAEVMVQNKKAMDAAEADTEAFEDGEISFLQRSSKVFLAPVSAATAKKMQDASRKALVALFRSKGLALKSEVLTSLATKVAESKEDVFAKVKILIQDLIERMLAEAGNEANQKGWCDKSIQAAEQKRDYAADEISGLNSEMATLEATRDKLTEELTLLAKEIEELDNEVAAATAMRSNESEQNAATVTEAKAGLEAVQEAITILDRFYKSAANEKLTSFAQGPLDDAPDTGFDEGEQYHGAQGDAGGVIGMLEVIEGDFTRTITETEAAEAQAQQDFLEYTTEAGKSKAEKTTAETQKKHEKDIAEASLETATDGLKSQMDILTNSIKELLELQPACIDTGMTYEERVAKREEEIVALKKGLCILVNFQQYGAEGVADAC